MEQYAANERNELYLGRQGESHTVEISFSVADWQEAYGDGSPLLIALRACDRLPYPVATVRDGTTIKWSPDAADTYQSGYGICELRWVVNDTVVKSKIWKTITVEAIADTGDVPPPYASWVNEVLEAAAKTEQAVANPPYIGANGNWFVWDFEQGAFTDSGISSKPKFVVVSALPEEGDGGIIYLVQNSGSGDNTYDEYIWVEDRWEMIGTTDIDLSGYALKSDVRIFFGKCSISGNTGTVTLDQETNARWDHLKDGDVLVCRFTAFPSGTLTISVKTFGAKRVVCNYNTSTGSSNPIASNHWRAGSTIVLTYYSDAGVWSASAIQPANTTYYGLTTLSSSVSDTSETKAATSKAVKTAYDAAIIGKNFVNMICAFRIVGVNTGSDECYCAPVGTWEKFISSYLNPIAYCNESSAPRAFRFFNSGIYYAYEPQYLQEGICRLYKNRACTQPVNMTDKITAGITYYYSDDYD